MEFKQVCLRKSNSQENDVIGNFVVPHFPNPIFANHSKVFQSLTDKSTFLNSEY